MESNCPLSEARVTMKLLELTRQTNYELIQENGQRRLTSPELKAELNDRPKGAEIFLGRLPRDCYEDEIMPILQQAGHLLELRLMLDFSGSTRGYAFALFENARVARHACHILDGHEIRPGHKIGVVKSIDNCRLFFGGVPKDKKKEEFADELGKILDGITEIFMYPNALDRTQNRGFIFVEFKDHRSAAMARRKLIPGRVILWNHEVAVDWADPELGDPVDTDVMETVTALFVRNLSLDAPHQEIRDIFQRTTGIPILKLKKINHFAFIHYENRKLAEYVLNIMTQPGGIAEYQQWEVRWAKPIETCKSVDRQRSINDAVMNNREGEDQPASSASSRRLSQKKRQKRPFRENRPVSLSSVSVNYQQLLQCFVYENFNAVCYFELYPTVDNNHICKMTVATAIGILLAFDGNVSPTKESAIEDTARDLYHRLRNSVENHELFLPNPEPYNWVSPTTSPILKFEACR